MTSVYLKYDATDMYSYALNLYAYGFGAMKAFFCQVDYFFT